MSKHDCEACIHKVVCALWKIQNELCDNECAYYQPTLTPPNEPLTCKGCMYAPDCPSEIHCCGCARMYADHYRRPPEGEANG